MIEDLHNYEVKLEALDSEAYPKCRLLKAN